MTTHLIKIFPLLLTLALSACQTIPSDDDTVFQTSPMSHLDQRGFEQRGLLPTDKFIQDDCGQICPYRLDENTFNDGRSNHYKVVYGDHIFIRQGTLETLDLLNEIEAISLLRDIDTIEVAGSVVWERTAQLATTPYAIGQSIYKRFGEADTLEDKILLIPEGTVNATKNLIKGTKEIGVTGLRLTDNVSHTHCEGMDCLVNMTEDVWYGVNTLTGKHKDARALHRLYGTEYETQNPLLKREIDRISYISSLTDTSFKYGLGVAKIPAIAEPSTALGYYRNASFLSRYEDSRKQETAHKARLRDLGLDEKLIAAYYGNSAFARVARNYLTEDLLALIDSVDITQAITEVSALSSRYEAHGHGQLYAQARNLNAATASSRIESFENGLRLITNEGQISLLLKSDYLLWTKELETALQNSSRQQATTDAGRPLHLHVIGSVSDTVQGNMKRLGVHLYQIPANSLGYQGQK